MSRTVIQVEKNRKGSQNGEKTFWKRGIQKNMRKEKRKNPEYEKEDMDERLGSI